MSEILALVFDKELYSLAKARAWLIKHKFKPIKKVHETKKQYTFFINECKPNVPYIGKQVKPGVKMLIKNMGGHGVAEEAFMEEMKRTGYLSQLAEQIGNNPLLPLPFGIGAQFLKSGLKIFGL